MLGCRPTRRRLESIGRRANIVGLEGRNVSCVTHVTVYPSHHPCQLQALKRKLKRLHYRIRVCRLIFSVVFNYDRSEIQQNYVRFQNELQSLARKIGELEVEADEHSLVLNTLEEALAEDPDRKCFRLVGGVLVERTVKDISPALQTNRDGVCSTLLLDDEWC